MKYPRLFINLLRLEDNVRHEVRLLARRGIAVMGVNKVFNGNIDTARALVRGGIEIIAESRVEHLARLAGLPARRCLLRAPAPSEIPDVVRHADISLTSARATLRALSAEAVRQRRVHEVMPMVDLGDLLMLASVLCYAAYTVAGKWLAPRFGATALTALPFALATAVLVPTLAVLDPAALARALHLTARELATVVFLGVVATAVCYLAWNRVPRELSAGELSYSLYLQPVAGALFSRALLGEPLGPRHAAGAALILAALASRGAR